MCKAAHGHGTEPHEHLVISIYPAKVTSMSLRGFVVPHLKGVIEISVGSALPRASKLIKLGIESNCNSFLATRDSLKIESIAPSPFESNPICHPEVQSPLIGLIIVAEFNFMAEVRASLIVVRKSLI